MITETPPPRPATSSESTVADTDSAAASVLPFRRRGRNQKTPDTPGRNLDGMPRISCYIRVDLRLATVEDQLNTVVDLHDLPLGTGVRLDLPEGWPNERVLHVLAQAAAARRLDLKLEGTADACRAWAPSLRDLVGNELALIEERLGG